MMKTGCTGTERPKNGTGGPRRVVLALAVLLLTCVLMAGAVSADGDNVAKIGNTEYATLYDAFNATVTGQETTITLLRDAKGGGAKLQSGNNTILDLNGHTYTAGDPTVGSTGTETNCFQLLKGSNLTIKNGTLNVDPNSTQTAILIQNYCNLTLENVIVDGTNLAYGSRSYAASNNFGHVVYKGNTKIIAHPLGVAFDVWYGMSSIYDAGVSVTIEDNSVVIEGPVEYGHDNRITDLDTFHEKAILKVPATYGALTVNPSSTDITDPNYYGWEVDGNMKKLVPCKPAVPSFPISEPEKDPVTGETTITSTSQISVDTENNHVAVIKDESSGITMRVTFEEEITEGISITGNVTEVAVTYDSAPISVPVSAPVPVPGTVSYTMNLSLENATTFIPEINPALNSTVAEQVTDVHPGFYPVAMITAETNVTEINNNLTATGGIELVFTVPKAWVDSMGGKYSNRIWSFHAHDGGVDLNQVRSDAIVQKGDFFEITIYGKSFSTHGIAGKEASAPQPTYSSSSGNMDNAYRVLFNDGATTLSVQTDLSSGDKLTKPETPVKDGYTFAGWYKDSACTQGWDFETGISGDMTLYAKWTAAGSSGETEATATPTKTQTAVTTPQPTKTQTAAATTSAPEATTAAGVSPTLTQAPAPVAGALFGLLAAGVLLRRRFQ